MTDISRPPAHETPEPSTLTALLLELHIVQLKVKAARHRERKESIAQAQWLVTEFGIQPHELRFPPEYGPERGPSDKLKYYDPETGRTWSGTRLDVVRLPMGVQFIAGSTLRRITHVDLAAQMDSREWPAPRRPFFPAQN